MQDRSRIGRIIALVVLVAAAIVLFIVLKGGDGDGGKTTRKSGKAAEPAARTIVVRGGKPAGGVAKLDYRKGERVRFRVSSDVADEVHVHGYDLMKDVAAGGSVSFDFAASIEGVFEVELEGRKQQIAELTVRP
jgi:hypothetical protein